MTQGFYEQLGVPPDADAETLRQAYHRQVARVTKRRRDLSAQGGDTAQLDLARAQLDDAWQVLSIPARRQRYDAMLTHFETDGPVDAPALWGSVGDALVPPAVAAAVRLLSAATKLAVPTIGLPEPEPAPAPFPEASNPTLAPSATLAAPTEPMGAAEPEMPSLTPIIEMPKRALKVVETQAAPVIVLPKEAPRQKTLSGDLVGQLTDAHGYSGGLLRAVREAKGISLQQVADTTRISVRYLQAIEADAHDRLPSAPFVKGYVREVARMLKLDDDAVVTGYMRRMQ